ncbi:MAG: tRNA 2-selenouridine(34) synthase MnmH, partial [Pseudohongiellaceae bacterium]
KAQENFSGFVLDNLDRIRKRLGSERHQQLADSFSEALGLLYDTGDSSAFAPGIRHLLEEYYDPMYEYLLQKRQGRIRFRGAPEELMHWLDRHYP